MDVRLFKKLLGIGLLAAAATTNSTAYAANASVQVDVNLPTILVMYHYDVVTLNLDQTALGGFLVGGTASACAGGYCDGQGTVAVNVATIGTATSVSLPALTDPGLADTTTNIELVDVVGVRALGCPTGFYDATYDVSGDAGVTVESTVAVTNIDGASCSLAMTTGNLDFDLDFTAITAGAISAQAVFDVTIAGI